MSTQFEWRRLMDEPEIAEDIKEYIEKEGKEKIDIKIPGIPDISGGFFGIPMNMLVIGAVIIGIFLLIMMIK